MEMKTCLAMLLPHFTFELAVPASHITADAQLTIGMGRGLPVHIVRITKERDDADWASDVSTAVQSEAAASEASTALQGKAPMKEESSAAGESPVQPLLP